MGMVGPANHRYAILGCECQFKNLCSLFGVLSEDFVEVTLLLAIEHLARFVNLFKLNAPARLVIELPFIGNGLRDIVVAGKILPNEGGSAILYQHLFWFLGHPEVYIIILPSMGIVSEVLSVNSRKPIFGYLAMVGSLFVICILSLLVWAHHMFVTGLNPFLGGIFVLLTLLIAVPSAIKVFNWLTTLCRLKLEDCQL